MGAPRRKNLIASRRRTDDDGDDEGSPVGPIDDSSSAASVPSDVDDDADAEGSETSETGGVRKNGVKRRNGEKATSEKQEKQEPVAKTNGPSFATSMIDTEAMMNGLKLSGEKGNEESISFDDAQEHEVVGDANTEAAANVSAPERGHSVVERRRQEHEEYKKKRDQYPAFVPNRGGFFMHDHRSAGSGQNGFRPMGRGGRGRGRGGLSAVYPVSQNGTGSNSADAPWSHDLHATVAQADPQKSEPSKPFAPTNAPSYGSMHQQRLPLPPSQAPPPNRSFSCTTLVGRVQVRVYIPGMSEPAVLPVTGVNQHTRLPHHRPPLRRDKPVRISLPDWTPKYIFPSIDRSFIFIPRAQRPNQQGFGRGRGKGSFSGYSGFPSARNSLYGGSAYSPSVALSRRSSMAREAGPDIPSPAGSVVSRNRGAIMDFSKPVVRLPPARDPSLPQVPTQVSSYSNSPTPIVNLPQPQAYPLPPKPHTQNWSSASSLPMHQPRAQKQISVADIESPAALNFHPPQQQQQQPFHQQVPVAVNGQGFPPEQGMLPHSRRPSHPSQRGTPLSQIPERAIHAPAFQPFPYAPTPTFYHMPYAAPVYFYPPPGPPGPPGTSMPPPPMTGSPFVTAGGQSYPYVLSAPPPTSAPPPEATSQPGTVAHESNGMVYYYDSSQLPAPAEDPASYQAVTFAPQNGYVVPQPAVYYQQ